MNELNLAVEPVLFDAGLPLVRDGNADYKLMLVDVHKLSAHTAQLHDRLMEPTNE